MRRMTKRRERMRPDTRPRWDDPDLKVVGPDGELYTAEEISEAHQECMQFNRAPTWRRDPSYAWRERAIRFREARAAAIAKQQKIDDNKKLAVGRESTEQRERADHAESTARDERAARKESTASRERVEANESTVRQERAVIGESTEHVERAVLQESAEGEERAETRESTDQRERGPPALKPAEGPLPPRPPPKNAPKARKRRKTPPC